jgi:cytidine deaminase
MTSKNNTTAFKELISLSAKASKKAYAPYSNLHVGAAILTVKGNMYSGCNVENASFGLTCCAERNAIFQAVREEGPSMKLVAVAISVDSDIAIPPCGACRQVIAEFVNRGKDGTTVIFNSEEGRVMLKIETLLPGFFEFKK